MKKLGIIAITLVLTGSAKAQDMHSSNLHYLSTIHNPAMCALNNELEVGMSYRTQWRATGAPYNAISGMFGTNIFPGRKAYEGYMSIGFNIYNEQSNEVYDVTSFSGIAAYHLPVHKGGQVSMALNFGYYGQRFGREAGSWESQHNGLFYDPDMPSGELFSSYQRSAFDVGSGAVYSLAGKEEGQKLLQIGMGVHHIARPDLSYLATGTARLPVRLVVHGSSYLAFQHDKYAIQPMFLYQNQGTFQSLNLGAMAFIRLKESARTTSSFGDIDTYRAGFGMFVRNGDAFIMNVSFQKSSWHLGLAYDVTTSALKANNNARGAFEFQLQYSIPSFQLRSLY